MFRIPRTFTRTSGRSGAHCLFLAAAMFALVAAAPAAANPQQDPQVSVTEQDGVYAVAATFVVNQPPAFVFDVLTDYAQIPRFMPEVRTSNVLERSSDRAVVEQEAIARFMLFSKRVHLVLEVEEANHRIRFRDRCAKSFKQYEGTWTFAERDGQTEITYALSARPSFDVPGFVLKHLLGRDASNMIERLTLEIQSRAKAGALPADRRDWPR